jgi:hypothetical protein
MLTQLVFEHSLRIRMVAEVANGSTGKTPKTSTPGDTASVVGSERTVIEGHAEGEVEGGSTTTHAAEGSNGQTLVASTSSVKGKDKAKVKEVTKEVDNESSNLVGKINNLMSTVRIFWLSTCGRTNAFAIGFEKHCRGS